MALDAKGLAKACGGDAEPISQLCRAQLEVFEAAAKDAGQLLVACTQEAPLFVEAAGELGDGGAELSFCNIRERAGWCREDAGKASKNLTAKMAALLAEATLDIPGTTSVGLRSGHPDRCAGLEGGPSAARVVVVVAVAVAVVRSHGGLAPKHGPRRSTRSRSRPRSALPVPSRGILRSRRCCPPRRTRSRARTRRAGSRAR